MGTNMFIQTGNLLVLKDKINHTMTARLITLFLVLCHSCFVFSQPKKSQPTKQVTKPISNVKQATVKVIKQESKEDKLLKARGMPPLLYYDKEATIFNFSVGSTDKHPIRIENIVSLPNAGKNTTIIKLTSNHIGGVIHCPGEKYAFKIRNIATGEIIPLSSTNGIPCSLSWHADSTVERNVFLTFETNTTLPLNFDLIEYDTTNAGAEGFWHFRNIRLSLTNEKIKLKDFFGNNLSNITNLPNEIAPGDKEYLFSYKDDVTGGVFYLPYKVLDHMNDFDFIFWTGSFENGYAEGEGSLRFQQKNEPTKFAYLKCYMIEGKLTGDAEYWQYVYSEKKWFKNNATNLKFTNSILTAATIQLGDNLIFEGETKGIWPEGQGKWTNTDGSWYEGSFKDGVENGEGCLRTTDGLRRYGNFTNGVPNGHFVVKRWTLMGLASDEWEIDYVMGQPKNGRQTNDGFTRLLNGKSSGSSGSSSTRNVAEEENNNNKSSNQPKLVEFEIKRDGKKCCAFLEESYCFLIYEDGKQLGGEKTISQDKNGDWHTDCQETVSWKVCNKTSYTEALKQYYKKKYEKNAAEYRITE